ncbi:MAG: L-2-amino-thiazoline-4-carboxylic acid hydrolase [Deltaproteobacteria bacterium]|nr:L-2-amino-thiazoline-4-carboxylic acid hydrolase [Deltaproteobacteria bacterium]
MGIKEMSPEEIQIAIDGGYRAAGNVFRCMMDVLEARYGKEETRQVAEEVVRKKAQTAGEMAATRFGKGGLENLAEAHRAAFPGLEVLEFSSTRYVIRDHNCPIVEGWRRSGLSEDRIRELGDHYCWGDLYFAQCFNPRIRLQFQARLAARDSYCQWIFTLEDAD